MIKQIGHEGDLIPWLSHPGDTPVVLSYSHLSVYDFNT